MTTTLERQAAQSFLLASGHKERTPHLVVGFDFSVASAAAFTEAARLALFFKSKLSVVHVREAGLSQRLDPMPMPDEELVAAMRLECSNSLAALSSRQEASATTINYLVRKGVVQMELLAYCEESHADLLVIGEHNATWLKRLMRGNHAKELVHQCALPLLTVAPTLDSGIKDVLVAVDFSDVSRQAMQAAIELAQAYQATLHVLHVGGALLDKLSAGKEFQSRAQEQFDVFMGAFMDTAPDIAVERHLVFGSPVTEIVACAKQIKCGLLVLGSLGREGIQRWVQGNTAESVSQHLHCSLLTVRT